MPPKRKSRASTRTTTPAASSPAPFEPSPPALPASSSPSPSHTAAEETLLSSWTTPQETGLFKALIKYKPTGLHKHARMLSIRSYLLSNGYIHPLAPHTRISGLWLKLGTLYDLKALDQREDSVDEDLHPEYDSDSDPEGPEGEDDDEDEERQALRDLVDFRGHAGFELEDHGEEFAGMMWRRRFAEDEGKARKRRRSSSPVLPELLDREAPVRFVPSFGVGDEEDEGKIRVARGRGGRSARGGRESLKRGRVQDSVAESEEAEAEEEEQEDESEGEGQDEEEEEGEGDEGDEDEDEEEEDEEESEDQESSEEQEETTAPATRGRGGRGRGAATTRGRGRGRRRGR